MYSPNVNKLKAYCKCVRKNIYPLIQFKLHHNIRYDPDVFLDMLTYIAMTKDFTQNGSRTLRLISQNKSPSSKTLLYHIGKFEPREVMNIFTNVFEKIHGIAKKQRVFGRPVDVAIDLTEWMYYGNSNDPYVVGTKYKNGTKFCYRFATVNIVEGGKRFTLLALPMSQFTPKDKVLEQLIAHAKKMVEVRRVYVDRGFFSVPCINMLKKLGVKYLMPATQNRKIKPIVEKAEAPSIMDYTMGDTRYEHATFKLVIVRNNKNPEKKVAFAVNMNINEENAQAECDNYGKRWGIETSYRVKGDFRPKTTSKEYVVRLFYFMWSVCLYNLWVLVKVIFGMSGEKPMVSAKIFGTILYTTFYIDDGG